MEKSKKWALFGIISIIAALTIFLLVFLMPSYLSVDNVTVISAIVGSVLGMLISLIHSNAERNKKEERIKEIRDSMFHNNNEKSKLLIDFLSNSSLVKPCDELESETTSKSHDFVGNETKEALLKQKCQQDILSLMFENMEEIRDYFTISKRQVRLSFALAIINCIVGIILLCLSVYYALTNSESNPAIIAAVAGGISQLFAATSLIVHKKSISQLNHYYNALHDNEMFLSTVNLVGNLGVDKQDEMYIEIIRNELKVRHDKVCGKS
jgi:hypothetical protein